MLRTAIPVVAVMLALLTGVGTKAPDRPFPIYPRPGGPPRAAAAMVKGTSLSVPRRASTTADKSVQLRVDLNP
ncbi:MAG TPA: hypothetical protein VGP67_04745 [Gaiellales bacterium]|jgi:hypothetical protein|nr:hypothetical protein [Gaiellales bacterium]